MFYLVITIILATATISSAEDSFSHIWGGFGTSLVTRTDEQRHNTITAARDIDGVIVPPGGVFSFNSRVGARDREKGYTAAPIIDSSGQLQDSPGGGICQLASTIYNAGLLAGMQIVERHPHSRTVGHVPPGRDATISSWRKDLKLKNPFSQPLKLYIDTGNSRLAASFRGTTPPPFTVEIKTERYRIEPETVVSGAGGKTVQRGVTGYSTVTRRIIRHGAEATEELISSDNYPAPSRIIGDTASGRREP